MSSSLHRPFHVHSLIHPRHLAVLGSPMCRSLARKLHGRHMIFRAHRTFDNLVNHLNPLCSAVKGHSRFIFPRNIVPYPGKSVIDRLFRAIDAPEIHSPTMVQGKKSLSAGMDSCRGYIRRVNVEMRSSIQCLSFRS
jgi:hypothetical protein